MRKEFISFIIIGLVFIAMMGCSKSGDVKEVDLSKTEAINTAPRQPGVGSLRIAVGGMITPGEGFVYYKRLLDYIGEKLGRKIEFVDRQDYSEINKLLANGNLDAAFVCGGPYVDAYAQFGVELLAAPYAYGGAIYYSYIIVHKDSPIKNIADLKGKTFAFTDPLSNTGRLAPAYMLSRMNETPDSFFKSYAYTHAHDKSIKAVADGVEDGAAVDSLIWEYGSRTDPRYTSRTRIILKSPPYGIPPIVARPGLDRELKKALREILLNVHADDKGKEILKGMMIDKFVPIEDSAYDSIREMKQWIAKH